MGGDAKWKGICRVRWSLLKKKKKTWERRSSVDGSDKWGDWNDVSSTGVLMLCFRSDRIVLMSWSEREN